jgi:hypothetical protein
MKDPISKIENFFYATEETMFSRRGKWISVLVFTIAIFFLYNYIGIFRHIHRRPCSIHMSAQTSRACIALNYYENNMNFFTPQYQRTLQGNGYTGMEFPIIFYSAAICYKLFGFNEMYFRCICLLITTFGLYLFYLFSLHFSKSRLMSLAVMGAILLSPVLLFYTPNFFPDSSSLGLVMGSWYFLFKYIQEKKIKDLNRYIILATLAILLKASAGMCFGVVAMILILDHFRFFKKGEVEFLFPNKKKIIVRIGIGSIVVFAWYKYAAWFPASQGDETFLMSPNSFETWEGLVEVVRSMKNFWFYHYFPFAGYVVLGSIAGIFLFTIFMADRLLITIIFTYILGCICYFLIFMNQFIHHDYYVITMFPLLFFIGLSFLDTMRKISQKGFGIITCVVTVLLFVGLKIDMEQTREKYSERYSNDIYYWTGEYRAYEDLEPKLRKAGIKRTDRTVTGYDESDCASLYLMNQLGCTFTAGHKKPYVDSLLNHPNTKYLVLNDSAKFRKDFGYELSAKVILRHRGLLIYKIK